MYQPSIEYFANSFTLLQYSFSKWDYTIWSMLRFLSQQQENNTCVTTSSESPASYTNW